MATAEAAKEKKKGSGGTGSKDRPWIPRFWDGMTVLPWFSQLWRNRFRISLISWPMVILISGISLINSALAALQAIFYRRKIEETQITEAPIFILGHWRSGTTMLHELLVLDSRYSYPTTYECFAPSHFLFSGRVVPRMLRFLLPDKRPMDNMAAGWGHPQEDEFALCSLGVPSPYFMIMFPKQGPAYPEYLTLEGVPPAGLARWKQAFVWFLKCLTLRGGKRIVLKSPPHTCRIKTLLDLFPDARFVHIVRDPYVIFPSTVNLWKRLGKDQGCSTSDYHWLDEHVYETFTRMYAAFERDRALVDPSRYSEVRYEELVQDPVGQMQRVYQQLGLGQFESVRPAFEKYAATHKDYKTNRWELPPDTKSKIAQRWRFFFDKYGYEL